MKLSVISPKARCSFGTKALRIASLCSLSSVSIFRKGDKESAVLQLSSTCQLVSNVDNFLSTHHPSANRILRLRIFHLLWLCGQSLFSSSPAAALVSNVSLTALPLDARVHSPGVI